MVLDVVTKILDFINPSTKQLKFLLTMSIVAVGIVYWAGYKISNYENSIKNINTKTNKNTELINKVNKKVTDLEKGRSADFNMIYQDMIDINKRNNQYWNNKFDILLKYGNTNKDLVRDLINSEEMKQQIEDENFIKSKEYINRDNNSDTLK